MPRLSQRLRNMLILAFAVAVVAWLAGDFVYSRIVASRVAAWEKTIERDALGVQVGAESRTIEGDPQSGRSDIALLLVHGINDTPQAFQYMVPPLSERGYALRLLRLPGFGVPVARMDQCTSSDWVDAVCEEAAGLRESHRLVFVVGHSLGGAATLGAALNQPELANGLILLAPAVGVASRRSPILPTRFWQRLGDTLLVFSTVYQSPYDRNDARDPSVRNPDYKPPFSTRNIVRQSMRLMDDNRSRASEIRLPLLMVLSRDDRVVDWRAAERFFENVSSSFRQLKFYDTSGHSLNVDRDRSAIVKEMIRFIERESWK